MTRDWADLPEELLSLILSNLFAKDKHNFVLVCKSWNKAAQFSPFRQSPCLMFYQRSNCAWKLFQYNGFFSMSLPQHLNQAEIRCSKHGWMLLMSKIDRTLFFYDPFNNETIHLPKANSNYTIICFFHPPTSPDCFIVGMSTMESTKDVEIGVLRRGESEWHRCVYHSKSDFKLSVCTPVLMHQQLLHLLDVGGDIGTFDITKSGSPDSWNVQTKCLWPSRLRGKIRQHFLIELKDEQALLSVLVTHEERKVNVFRLLLLAGSRMRWDPVEDLGDKVLFVSHTASFAATAPRQSMANRIYFTKMHGDNDNVVFYCLNTRRYHSCKGDFSRKKSYGFRDLSFATWITATPSTPEFPRDLTW